MKAADYKCLMSQLLTEMNRKSSLYSVGLNPRLLFVSRAMQIKLTCPQSPGASHVQGQVIAH